MKVKDLLTPMAWLEMLPRKFLRDKETASADVCMYTYFSKPFPELPDSFSQRNGGLGARSPIPLWVGLFTSSDKRSSGEGTAQNHSQGRLHALSAQ